MRKNYDFSKSKKNPYVKSLPKHTPTPWKVDWLDNETGWILTEAHYYRKGLPLYLAAIVTSDSEGLFEKDPKKQKANADFIVHAVNSHDALVQACRSMLVHYRIGTPDHAIHLLKAALEAAGEEV